MATLGLLSLLLAASGARATELVYWANYRAEPATIGFANIDGSGGGSLNLAGTAIEHPEGMAYDPVTNRLFVANDGPPGGEGAIAYVNLDGSGAGLFTPAGAPVAAPEGVAIDPTRRTIYWANGGSGRESIAWANLDTGIGGTLDTAGAKTDNPYRLAIDPVGGRVYWSNSSAGVTTYQYAGVDNAGGGELAIANPPQGTHGLAADPSSGRLYILASEASGPQLSYVGLGGGAASAIPLGEADDEGYGLAVDPVLGRAYWGNFGRGSTPVDAIGLTSLGGVTGGISPATAPVDGPQDPVIIKSPNGTGAPLLSRSHAALACSSGSWAPDYPGSFVYQSPRSLAYQWTLDGTSVPGATAPALTATSPGTYGCTVTAANQAGSGSQSAATTATVSKARLELTARKKLAMTKPGKRATIVVRVSNRGDLGSKAARLCLKLPKGTRNALKGPPCKTLKALAAGGGASAKLTVKAKRGASGSYALRVTLPSTKAAKVRLKVLG